MANPRIGRDVASVAFWSSFKEKFPIRDPNPILLPSLQPFTSLVSSPAEIIC